VKQPLISSSVIGRAFWMAAQLAGNMMVLLARTGADAPESRLVAPISPAIVDFFIGRSLVEDVPCTKRHAGADRMPSEIPRSCGPQIDQKTGDFSMKIRS
jgi:hypothetical protein